ncbi:MAG: hypothetical protein II171_07920 [Bacteroidales bacterium]|nr:hypothetical protein [Bacteroidales bacterium]
MLKEFFQRQSIRKSASTEPTGMMPLRAIHSAVAFIDVEDTSFNECKNALMSFFRDWGIKGDIFFIDFRKLTEGERLITSITTTILKKDLNWYGRPSREKINLMLEGEPDMFLSLLPETNFALEFMAHSSRARFKVGRAQLEGDVFDLVVRDPADKKLSELESFHGIEKILEKIV